MFIENVNGSFKEYDNSLAKGMGDFCKEHNIKQEDLKYLGMLCFYAMGAYFDGNGYTLNIQLKRQKERYQDGNSKKEK